MPENSKTIARTEFKENFKRTKALWPRVRLSTAIPHATEASKFITLKTKKVT